MNVEQGGMAVADAPDDLLNFLATDVTGQNSLHVDDVRRDVLTGAVVKALAARMSLPEDTPYSLYDGQGTVLEDDRPIADQVKPGESVMIVPKAHLGALTNV
jgi:hypothetical protein